MSVWDHEVLKSETSTRERHFTGNGLFVAGYPFNLSTYPLRKRKFHPSKIYIFLIEAAYALSPHPSPTLTPTCGGVICLFGQLCASAFLPSSEHSRCMMQFDRIFLACQFRMGYKPRRVFNRDCIDWSANRHFHLVTRALNGLINIWIGQSGGHMTSSSIAQPPFAFDCHHKYREAEGYAHWHCAVQLFADMAENWCHFLQWILSIPTLLEKCVFDFHMFLDIRLGVERNIV